jgi:hypothetical protein
MAQVSQQFTPAQILEAGRRAESEGRVEYAIQFYRHLTDHLARTLEAAAAREALIRLGAPIQPGSGPGGQSPMPNGANGNYRNGAAGMNGLGSHGQNGAGQLVPLPASAPGARPPGAAVAPEAAGRRKFALPRTRRRYRTGRFVARTFTVIGFIEAAIGVVLIGLAALSLADAGAAVVPTIIAVQPPLIVITAGISIVVVGLLLVLGGQLARAMFDQASATRDIAQMDRSRAAFEAGIPDEPAPEH